MISNFLASYLPFETNVVAPSVNLDRVGVIILAGGEGKRLEPLTKTRCKPALTFGGRYSLIDVPISHAISSGLKKIYVIGQYLATTLQKHLFQTYIRSSISQQEITMLSPEEREGKEKVWYEGTADAIRQNLAFFASLPVDYFLILSGDQLYNINFQQMINFGIETEASMVIAAQPVGEKEAKRMGLLKIQPGKTKLIDFVEKPQEKNVLQQFRTDEVSLHKMGYDPHSGKQYLGSMGIYFFTRQALFQLLQEDQGHDFGKHLIRTEMAKGKTHVFLYDGYWEDIGTIESYYHANLALTRRDSDDRKTGFQSYDESSPIFTPYSYLPSAKIRNTYLKDAIICEGSIIEAQEIYHSIIGKRSVIRKGSVIHDAVLLGNEFYESPSIEGHRKEHFTIGEECFITKAIIDENVSIGNNVRLINRNHHTHYDSDTLFVRDGIIIVPRGTRLPDHFIF